MINLIIDAISIKLYEAFGEGSEIYREVKQGLEEPCFLISLITKEKESLLKNRSNAIVSFIIQYFPKKDDEECYKIGDLLEEELLYIKTTKNDLLRGSDIHYEVVDGVLQFFISYNYIVMSEETVADSMEIASIFSAIKE